MVDKNGIEVAPIYDVLSIVMHGQVEHDLAMAFGTEFKHDGIRAFQLREFSEDIGLDPKLISKRIIFISNKVEKALNTITVNNALLTDDELIFIKRLSETIEGRCWALRESAKEMMEITFD